MCRYCDQPTDPREQSARGASVAIGIIERERIDERRMREKYERALDRIANGRAIIGLTNHADCTRNG